MWYWYRVNVKKLKLNYMNINFNTKFGCSVIITHDFGQFRMLFLIHVEEWKLLCVDSIVAVFFFFYFDITHTRQEIWCTSVAGDQSIKCAAQCRESKKNRCWLHDQRGLDRRRYHYKQTHHVFVVHLLVFFFIHQMDAIN